MKIFTLMLLMAFGLGCYAEDLQIRTDVIEIDSAVLNRHVLNDIPGAIVALIPDESGKLVPTILGQKVLKKQEELPKILAKPTELISQSVVKSVAAGLNYLSFASASMDNKDEVRFTVTQTAYSSILDNEINWKEFDKRIKAIRKANPNLPKGTKFGVVRVADVITINYQVFSQVKNSSKISGWGFSGNSKYLSQKTDVSNSFSLGVALSYSDLDMSSIWQKAWPIRQSDNSASSDKIRKGLQSVETIRNLENIETIGAFQDSINIQSIE